MNWLAEDDNYSKWHGDGNKTKGGITKEQMVQDVADLINSKGVKSQWTWHQVKSKIERIEEQRKQAFEFSTSVTGAGKKDDDKLFEDSVLRYWIFSMCLLINFRIYWLWFQNATPTILIFYMRTMHMIATWKTLTMTVTLQTLKQLTAASTKQYSSNQGISLTKHSTKTKTSSKATMKPSSNSSRRGKNVFKPDISARRDELMCDFLESTIAKKKRAHEDNGEHIEKLAKQF